jgi:hypothetical protein
VKKVSIAGRVRGVDMKWRCVTQEEVSMWWPRWRSTLKRRP